MSGATGTHLVGGIGSCCVHGWHEHGSLPCVTTDLVFHGSVWKTPTQAVLDGADPSSVGINAEKEFPVSDGIQHHAVEAADGPDDMGSLSGQVRGRAARLAWGLSLPV